MAYGWIFQKGSDDDGAPQTLTHHDQDNYCETRDVGLGGIGMSPVWIAVFSHLLAMPLHSSTPGLNEGAR